MGGNRWHNPALSWVLTLAADAQNWTAPTCLTCLQRSVFRGIIFFLVYFIHSILSKVRWKWNWNGKINASSVCIPMAAFAVLGRPRLVLIKLTFGWVENTYQYFSIVFQYEHWHKNIENSIQFSWDWKYGAGLSTEICRKSTISVQCNLGKENWKKFKIHFHAIL